MSKERELLKRWVLNFGHIHPDIKVLKETKELLDQPEQTEQEPETKIGLNNENT